MGGTAGKGFVDFTFGRDFSMVASGSSVVSNLAFAAFHLAMR